jgi:hypothetical protein
VRRGNKSINRGSKPKKKLGFWIGFGWETQNPKKIQKLKTPKIQNPSPKKTKNPIFFVFFGTFFKLKKMC